MMTAREIKAIFQTLHASAQKGLNASLTPDECKALLIMFRQLQTNQKTRRPTVNRLIDSLAESMADAISSFVEPKAKRR
jgi:hypothetical protein